MKPQARKQNPIHDPYTDKPRCPIKGLRAVLIASGLFWTVIILGGVIWAMT